MRLLWKVLSEVIICTFSFMVSAADSELLVNGDFEISLPDGLKLNNATIMNEGGINNSKVLKLEGKDSSAVIKDMKLAMNQRYKLSYQVKAGDKVLTGNKYQGFRVYVSWGGQDGKAQKRGTEWQDSFPDTYQSKSLIFTTPASPKKIMMNCELKDAGSLYLDNFKLEALPPEKLPDVKISISRPFLKNIIYSSDPVSEITGSISASKNVSSADLKLSERDSGKLIFENKFANIKGFFNFSIPAEKLEYGKYILSVTPFAKDGKTLDKAEIPIWKLEKASVEVIFKNDLNCYVNGKLFYPVFFFRTGCIAVTIPSDKLRSAFYYARKNGINTFLVHPGKLKESLTLLDVAKEFDCKIIFSFDHPQLREPTVFQKAFRQKLSKELTEHEALLGYFILDEPMWCGISKENVTELYNFAREIDPYRPIWINEAPRGTLKDLTEYAEYTDIWGMDIYPVPVPSSHSDLDDKTLSCVGKYTQIARKASNFNKPIWMILQGFSWDALYNRPVKIYPTESESLFMAMDASVNNSKAIGYWGIHCIDEPKFWNVLFNTTKMLADISGVTTLPDLEQETVKCNNPAIKFLTKEKDGKIYIIAVNESGTEQEVTFRGPFNASSMKSILENREIQCGKEFSDKVEPFGYRIYATGSLPEPVIKNFPVNEEIEKEENPFIQRARELNNPKYSGKAQWIWFPGKNNEPYSMAAFKKEFLLDAIPQKAEIIITADDTYVLFVNGVKAGEKKGSWNMSSNYDIKKFLKPGVNVIYAEAADAGMAPCAFLADISLLDSKGNSSNIITDSSWDTEIIKAFSSQASTEFKGKKAEKIADYGKGPWGDKLSIKP